MSSSQNAKPKTIVYVDGFNLYYRALKKGPHKWLNLEVLFKRLLPKNDVIKIKYYTANVSAHIDPQAPLRQQVYLDALNTLPTVEIVKGSFMTSEKFFPLVMNGSGSPEFRPESTSCSVVPTPVVVKVRKCEEKGSDVNLATHLVFDACQGAFDVAAVVSNDTDLVEPIRILRERLGLPVGLVCPTANPHDGLRQYASFIRRIREADLKASQFPDPISTASGNLHKPQGW